MLTLDGHEVVVLTPVNPALDGAARLRIVDEIRASAAGKATSEASAALSQDFLYDDDGMPGDRSRHVSSDDT